MTVWIMCINAEFCSYGVTLMPQCALNTKRQAGSILEGNAPAAKWLMLAALHG